MHPPTTQKRHLRQPHQNSMWKRRQTAVSQGTSPWGIYRVRVRHVKGGSSVGYTRREAWQRLMIEIRTGVPDNLGPLDVPGTASSEGWGLASRSQGTWGCPAGGSEL